MDTGQRPQNFIRDVGLADRFEEYPKLRELIKLKDDLISDTATPPMYLKTDVKSFDFKKLETKFDVILIEPPLEEYTRGAASVATIPGGAPRVFWNWDDILSKKLHFHIKTKIFIKMFSNRSGHWRNRRTS